MSRRKTSAAAARTPEGHPPLPASVSASRDRDGRLVYEIARPGRHAFVLVVCFLGVALAAALATVSAVRTRSALDTGIALSFTSLALVLWAGFLGADRTRVRVTAGVLILQGSQGDVRFELRDPDLRVEESGDRRSKKWRLTATGRAGHQGAVRAGQADPEGLMAVIALYRQDPEPGRDQAPVSTRASVPAPRSGSAEARGDRHDEAV